jgi:hypothetical protein
VDYFEQVGLPFVIGVNRFDGRLEHDLTTFAGRSPSPTTSR